MIALILAAAVFVGLKIPAAIRHDADLPVAHTGKATR